MLRGIPKSSWFFTLCLVLCFSRLISGEKASPEKPSPPPKSPSPSPEKCVIEPDFTSTEGELRTAIFAADTKGAAKILGRNETFGLGEGLRYLPEQTCAVVRTANRRRDPDIVAIQAIALSAKSTGQALKLANAIVVSFERECQCSLFNSTERDRMAGAFRKILEDPKELEYILAFGGPQEDSDMWKVSGRRRLRVTGNSPTDSHVCAYCDPPGTCNPTCNWCPSS